MRVIFLSFLLAVRVAAQNCTTSFTPVTASAAFTALNPGWNLGNTLDAIPDEGSWNNAPVSPLTFSQVKAKGFKSIRIPVTWAYHFVDSSPTWTVNKTFMDRVETVVDEALSLDLWVVLNVHHDSWVWADVSASGANITMIEEKFSALWFQIGKRFACKSSKLVFEAINEPPGTTKEHADELNKLNGMFLKSINDAGGFNSKRVVSLSGLSMDSVKTSQWFVPPTTFPDQPWGLQFHYYSPYDFIFSAWGKTIWGSDADKASLLQDFTLFNGNFSSVPTFIGEWSVSPGSTEAAARWKYYDYFLRTCAKFGYSSIMWDNGNDMFNRTANTWNDETAMSVLFNAVAGAQNTLADSTTDPSATSQNSSAYIFHKIGDNVKSLSADYLLNGNTLTAIKTSKGVEISTSQYTFSSSGMLTLSSSYLSTVFKSSSLGVLETLILSFSAGAPLSLQIVQYSTPSVATASVKVDPSADLRIPITYAGLPQVAAVKATLGDGTYLADSWTQYLGPLQQARWTFGDWSFDNSAFIVNVAGLLLIKGTGQNVSLTLEFFPRSLEGNSLNITFTQ